MPNFSRETEIAVPVHDLYSWHAQPAVLGRLLPPWESVQVEESRGTIQNGDYKKIRLRKLGIAFRWIARHRDHIPGQQFVDYAEGGPFRQWEHTHRFAALDAARSRLTDSIDYRLPLGWLGQALLGGMVARDLQRTFAWRHRRTDYDLTRQQATRRSRQRILIGGASGLVGSALQAYFGTGGHEVWTLVRRQPRPNANEIQWDPYKQQLDPSQLEGFDVIINLSGASIAGQRWTDKFKQTIRESRVATTTLLAETCARLERKPAVFISASAVGWYGNRGEEALDESSSVGQGFLPEICELWERCSDAAEQAGIRTVRVRIGVVLSMTSGALATMLLPFKLGVGGPLGDGRQFMSWISLEDLVGLFDYVIANPEVDGPVNATAPHPVAQKDFARTLGKVLRRPAFLPGPAFAVRLALGEMGQQLLLEGARVFPVKISQAGFPFLFPYLEDALRWELGRFS